MSDTTYQNDRPISTEKRDDLRRKGLADQLAKAVFEYRDPESLATGVFGEGGVGKTSTLALFQMALRQYPPGYNPPIVVEFNPWRITNQDALFTSFFTSLVRAIDRADPPSPSKALVRRLRSQENWKKLNAADFSKSTDAVSKYAIAVAGADALGGPLGLAAGALTLGAGALSTAARSLVALPEAATTSRPSNKRSINDSANSTGASSSSSTTSTGTSIGRESSRPDNVMITADEA